MGNGSIYVIANGWIYMMPQSVGYEVWQQYKISPVIITTN